MSRKSQSGTMSAFLKGPDTEGHFPLDLVIRKSVMFCTETVNKAKTKIPNTSSSEHLRIENQILVWVKCVNIFAM